MAQSDHLSHFPPSDALPALSTSDLAWRVLYFLACEHEHREFNRRDVLGRLRYLYDSAGQSRLNEALIWLINHGLIVNPYNANDPWTFIISSDGVKAVSEEKFIAFVQATAFPRSVLHPIIAGKAWNLFLIGDYDTAVFASFKAVEISVRDKSGCAGTGVQLMRNAFHKVTGPLRDLEVGDGEREAICSLFVGAFGTYRNPAGHREVSYSGPAEAGELLMMASHLMRVVDARTVASAADH